MAVIYKSQYQFSRGELSKRSLGLRNNDLYDRAILSSSNMVPVLQGGLRSRSGTKYILPMRNSADDAVLVEFQFSVDQTYLLALGDQYAYVYKDREPVLESAQTITGATSADPVVITINGHSYSDGDIIKISNVGGMTELNDRFYYVSNSATNAFELQDLFGNDIDGSGYTSFTSGGDCEKVFEISTPWSDSDLSGLSYFQVLDVIYFYHRDYKVRAVGRVSDTNWSVTTTELVNGPYLPVNSTATTMTPSAATGSITLTASANTFEADDVGRTMRLKVGANDWGWLEITGYTNATTVSATVKSTLGGTSATDKWRFSVYGGTTYGYPSLGVIDNDRMVVAGSKVFGDNLAFSQTGLYKPAEIDFAPSDPDGTVVDSNGLTVNVGSTDNDQIVFLKSIDGVVVGTYSSEYTVTGSGPADSQAITPNDRVVRQESTFGSSQNVRSQKIGRSILAIDRSGMKLREISYSFSDNAYKSRDASILNSDIFGSQVIRTAYQRSPDLIMWLVTSEGRLVSFIFDKEQEVEGFHKHEIGGEDSKVLDVAAIQRPDGIHSDVYLIVERTINGQTMKYVEYITEQWEEILDINNAIFVDSVYEFSSDPATNTVTGLWHLEGETVSVLTDGSPHPNRTVSNGQITLDREALNVKAGLSYSKNVSFLPPHADIGGIGPLTSRTTRINKFFIYLVDSIGISSGTDNSGILYASPFNGFNTNFNEMPDLYNGILSITPPSGYDRNDYLKIENTQPLPFGFNYVTYQIEVNE